MTKKIITITAISLAAVQFCAARPPRPARALSRLPAAVQQTVSQQLGDGRITGIETDHDDGTLTYDVDIVRDGQARDFTVGADGTLIEKEVFITELPTGTQSVIKSAVGTSAIDDLYQSSDNGEVDYSADIMADGHEREYTFAGDGRLLTKEVVLAELSPSAQKIIQQKTVGSTIDEIDESFEEVDPNYDVQIIRGGMSRDFTVNTNGELIEEQFFVTELPGPLQAAIQKESNGTTTGDIYKSVDSYGTNYDVDIGEGSAARTVTFDTDGTISEVVQPVNLADTPEPVQVTIKSLGGRIVEIDKSTEDGDVSYDVDLIAAGKSKSVNIGTDGKIQDDTD
ncbi:MAG TPA: hypothetical protein VGI03_11360 [Verrucomicrobiae bacterium]|jgi:uncharacterized membrane protein YkoI